MPSIWIAAIYLYFNSEVTYSVLAWTLENAQQKFSNLNCSTVALSLLKWWAVLVWSRYECFRNCSISLIKSLPTLSIIKETRQISKTLAFISTTMQLINQKILMHLSTMIASAVIKLDFHQINIICPKHLCGYAFSRQSYGRKVLRIQWDPKYGNFVSHDK
jgi:hypothetical protein